MDTNKTAAVKAFRLLFRPIARILLRAGVTWQEFSEICRLTYVEVATQEFGIRGRPTNISRVAIMTGFTRREVRRLRDILEREELAQFGSMNSATRVLSGWYSDAEFTDTLGEPLRLDVSGKAPSFETLCSRYASGVAASTMLKELKHVGAVVEDASGKLIAQMRVYMPVHMDPERMLTSGSVLEDIGETVAYNLHRSDDDLPRFERRATNTHMPRSCIPAFKQFLDRESQAFLELVDTWLSQHENKQANDCVRLGLGTYWIESTI
ncbi:MAG: DUF6502 family protein [Pseudomonadota bacterium]